MNIEEIHSLLVQKFAQASIPAIHTAARDPWIEVAPDALHEVALFLRDDERLRLDHLNDLCGVDYCEPDAAKAAKFGHDPHIEVVYHLTSFEQKHALKVKVKVPRWKAGVAGDIPNVPSVADVWAVAEWHEREAYDLVGVNFVGNPNMRRILCPEDWVGHPLRKDYEFPLEYHGIRCK
jgi:NADH-quinone oxidoreductase subunit C